MECVLENGNWGRWRREQRMVGAKTRKGIRYEGTCQRLVFGEGLIVFVSNGSVFVVRGKACVFCVWAGGLHLAAPCAHYKIG